jgi:hypothetical protein
MMSLKPCWILTITSSSFRVVCFLFATGTIGSRHGQATLAGSIRMTESGITLWTASALTQEGRVAIECHARYQQVSPSHSIVEFADSIILIIVS